MRDGAYIMCRRQTVISYLSPDKIQPTYLFTSIDPGDRSDPAWINGRQSFKQRIYAEQDAAGHITLRRNTECHGTMEHALLS